jgi:hypothetical protein
LPTSKDFQGKTGQRGSAVNYFLVQEPQYKKEAAIAHGVHGPGHSDHLLGASLPTSKDFQGKTDSVEALPFFCFYQPRNASTKKRPI